MVGVASSGGVRPWMEGFRPWEVIGVLVLDGSGAWFFFGNGRMGTQNVGMGSRCCALGAGGSVC